MSYYRPQTDPKNEPEMAAYPHPPTSDECKKISTEPVEAPKFEPTPCPPSKCHCPDSPTPASNCITKMIASQGDDIAKGEKATKFRDELKTLLTKANTAKQDYTRDKHTDLCKRWAEQDAQIAELIRKLECTVTCWECVLECYICPRLNELRTAQNWLDGDGKLPTDAHNLYDVQYWRMRDKEVKEQSFKRIQNVLTAWEKPAQTIDAALTNNLKLISDIGGKSLGTEPGKAIYDIFFRLVPLHLAIAPPSGIDWKTTGAPWKTNIHQKYTQHCPCDSKTSDPCCGVELSDSSMLQRLIGPQPYLVDPNKYFDLVCCLVENRYEPAKKVLAMAEAELTKVTNQINDLKAQLDTGLKSFEKDTRTAIPNMPNCDEFKPTDPDSPGEQGC